MTVICTDGKTMAADGLVAVGKTIVQTDCQKLHRLKDGSIFGAAGNLSSFEPCREYLENGGEKPKLSDDFDALVLRPDGTVCWYDLNLVGVVFPAPYAIGCGAGFALAAIDAGKTPAEAVGIACKRHALCGGGTMTLSLAQ